MTVRSAIVASLTAGSLFAVSVAAQQADPYAPGTMPAQQPAAPAQMAATTRYGERDHVLRYVGADGQLVTIVSGQQHDPTPPPKPPFDMLDTNHDGIITRDEAQAYLPLYNDYDNLVHHVAGVTPRMYARWDQR